MASSFTTSLGIEEMTTGEKTGTWGTITNFNWDIMDRIATYKAVAITTNADTATLTVREASPGTGTENLQDGMYRVIKFTGALDSDCTVTIAPNTTQVFFIVVNATTDSGSSGPYSVILSQGSGANVTVENGKSAVVYCDGAGGGAAVIDALSNLQLATVTASGDITSSGTFNALGDTAADDKAAIGYTAAEGVIITGQGSTSDITIKNDADTDVLTVATGTTNVDIVGDVTASTVNADGDTSAGDNATIGYTAAEGLILTGQGSTSDITVKNDADVTVFTVPTGTDDILFPDDAKAIFGAGSDFQIYHSGSNSYVGEVSGAGTGNMYFAGDNLSLVSQGSAESYLQAIKDGAVTLYYDNSAKIATTSAGATVTGNLSISEGGAVNISTPLLATTDHTATGLSAQMLAGGAISAFETVCIHTVTGEVVVTDASAFATARCIGIAPAAISDTATGEILLQGYIRDDTWNWTVGGTMYLSETAGDMTQTAPSTDGAFVQVLGIALTADVVYFNPSLDVIEHA